MDSDIALASPPRLSDSGVRGRRPAQLQPGQERLEAWFARLTADGVPKFRDLLKTPNPVSCGRRQTAPSVNQWRT
jgi:hypothetical protein